MRVAGDFNFWDSQPNPMRSLGSSGVWELFIPGVKSGDRYKLNVLGVRRSVAREGRPMAFATEHPPAQASVVFTSTYVWQDAEWLTKRAHADALREPMSIYEVHLGSWKQGLGYRQLADELVAYVKDLGFTHVEFLPVAEHPSAARGVTRFRRTSRRRRASAPQMTSGSSSTACIKPASA